MNQKTFDGACDTLRTRLISLVADVRVLMVLAQETAPTVVLDGFTVDEAQEEVVENATLALRHLEDTIMRVGKAKHVFLGDDQTSPSVADTEAAAQDAVVDEDDGESAVGNAVGPTGSGSSEATDAGSGAA